MKRQSMQSNYMRIHYEIANEIAMGIYKPGDSLPTHTELSKKYNVSRVTISEAIKELTRRGILRTQKGKGTFVVGSPMEIGNFPRFEGFSKFSNQNKNRKLTSKVIGNEIVPAPVEVAKLLGVQTGTPVVNIMRIRSVDGNLMSFESSFLLHSYVDMIDFKKEDLGAGSLYGVLREKADLVFGYSKENLRATYCPQKVGELLGLSEVEPILFINRVCGISEAELVECVEIYERSDISYTSFQSSRIPVGKPEIPPSMVWQDEVQSKLEDCFAGAILANEWYGSDETEKQQLKEALQTILILDPDLSAVAPDEVFGLMGISKTDMAVLMRFGLCHNETEGLEKTANFYIRQGKNKSAIAAACALAKMLSSTMNNIKDIGLLSEAAKRGAAVGWQRAIEAGIEEQTINVEKRLNFVEKVAKESSGWREAMTTYRDIFGMDCSLEGTVSEILCAFISANDQYADLLRCSCNYLSGKMSAIFLGVITGAFYSRRAFNQSDLSLLKEEKEYCRLLAGKFITNRKCNTFSNKQK